MKLNIKLIEDDLQAVACALLSQSPSFRIGPKIVTVKLLDGTPAHMSVGQALMAAALVAGGAEGAVTIGDLEFFIGPTL